MFSMTDERWRQQNKTLNSRLKLILRQGLFSDITIDVQGKEFKCHRLLLSLGSSYFERTFYHTFKNDRASSMTINDVTSIAFQCVLSFLYTDSVTFGNEKQAFQTWEAAEKFGMPDLKTECEIYLSEVQFRPANVWIMLEEASRLNISKIQQKCNKYIERNTWDCVRDMTFLSTTNEIALSVAKMDRLAVPEIGLLNALIDRVKIRSGSSKVLLQKYMEPYLRHVRFKAVEPKEFCNFIKVNPDLIDSRDSLLILQYLELPYRNALPSWCCKLPKRIWP